HPGSAANIFLPTKYTKSAKPFRHRQPRHEFLTRSPPGALAASRRGLAFCVADPIGSAHKPARIDPHQLTEVSRGSWPFVIRVSFPSPRASEAHALQFLPCAAAGVACQAVLSRQSLAR